MSCMLKRANELIQVLIIYARKRFNLYKVSVYAIISVLINSPLLWYNNSWNSKYLDRIVRSVSINDVGKVGILWYSRASFFHALISCSKLYWDRLKRHLFTSPWSDTAVYHCIDDKSKKKWVNDRYQNIDKNSLFGSIIQVIADVIHLYITVI